MTREDILNMPAGREMDALIAVLLGWRIDDMTATSPTGSSNSRHKGDDNWLPYYSDSTDDAWRVVEALEANQNEYLTDILRVSKDGTKAGLEWAVRIRAIGINYDVVVCASTFPLAICRAALFASMDGAK